VAYILDGSDPATRPLTFAYNGGPLTPSIWLHMGCLGPRKVALEPEGGMPQPPYRLADNPNTALGETDLVLVDAIGTGYSRPVDTTSGHRFWNVDGDIESFGQFIMMYLSRYERWSSPLYLFGESYGTTRSAGLSDYLADQGISLNGIVLLSTTLDLESVVFSNTNDIPYPLVLPTYTMIAGYHKRLPADLQQDLKRTRHEVEQWALSEYWQALAKGDALSTADRQNVLEKLAHYTGLPKQVVDWANLRVDAETFTHYLLADQKLRVGTVDGRYAGPDPEGFLKTSSFDPSITRIESAFITTFQIYLRQELGYKVDMPYYISARRLEGFVWDWGTPGFGGGYPETAIALRHAMLKNPFLKVLVMEGYYDLSTPYFAANYTMDHLGLPTQFRQNISYATYESGHMVYVDEKSHADLERDFANFLEVTARKGDRIGK
jgi:carboxypeptidase C (cathepsin A)